MVKHGLGGGARVVVAAGLIVAAFVAAMLIASGAPVGAVAIIGLVVGGTVVAASGYLLIFWTLEDTASPIALTILLGSAATSLFLTGACLMTGRSASTVFILWAVLVAALFLRTFRSNSLVGSTYTPGRSTRADLLDVASTFAIVVVVAVWCRRAAGLLPTLQTTGVVPIWNDYFIHATEIAQFGDPLAVGRSSFLLVGQPIVFYHYASYMLPAAIARLVDLPAFGLATSVLLPYGVLLAALGVYAFARTSSSEAIALLAAVALLLLPDASRAGFRNGFFGFHWLLLTAPGSGYGLGVAFTALTVMSTWRASRRRAVLWLGTMTTLSIFEFRAQIFILFAPALAMTMLWETDLVGRHRRAIALAMLGAAVGTVVGILAVPAARHAWLQFSAFATFLQIVHTLNSPTAYDGIYLKIIQDYGQPAAWVIGFWALIPVALGALTLLLPLAQTVAVRRTGWQRFDSFPIWCTAVWLVFVAVAPRAASGQVGEFQHRPFLLVYAAAFVWALLALDRAILAHPGATPGSWRARVLPLVLTVAVGSAWATSWNTDPAQPLFDWGKGNFGRSLDRGLLDAATFVRRGAVVGDTFGMLPPDPSTQLDDAATRFAALSDMPAYLARAGIQVINGAERKVVVEHRLAALQQIETTENLDEAFHELRAIGVTFLVVLGDRGPLFDPEASRAVFHTAGASVYRIGPTQLNIADPTLRMNTPAGLEDRPLNNH